eukprot:766411-Hanusia_phi.AAC.9
MAAEDNISNIDSERFSMAQNEVARLVHEHRTGFYLSHVIRQAQAALNNCTRKFLHEEMNVGDCMRSDDERWWALVEYDPFQLRFLRICTQKRSTSTTVEKEEAIRECAEEAHGSIKDILTNQTNIFLPQTLVVPPPAPAPADRSDLMDAGGAKGRS